MKIDDLLIKQDKDAILFQRQFHSIIARVVKEHGFKGSEARAELEKQLNLKMPHYIKKGLQLGLKWLE